MRNMLAFLYRETTSQREARKDTYATVHWQLKLSHHRPQQLLDLFSQQADVEQAYVVTDRETRRSRGFGFVVIQDTRQAQEAIQAYNGSRFLGRTLLVNEARERQERTEKPRSPARREQPN
jgi:RNA recognition motif-containing protein